MNFIGMPDANSLYPKDGQQNRHKSIEFRQPGIALAVAENTVKYQDKKKGNT